MSERPRTSAATTTTTARTAAETTTAATRPRVTFPVYLFASFLFLFFFLIYEKITKRKKIIPRFVNYYYRTRFLFFGFFFFHCFCVCVFFPVSFRLRPPFDMCQSENVRYTFRAGPHVHAPDKIVEHDRRATNHSRNATAGGENIQIFTSEHREWRTQLYEKHIICIIITTARNILWSCAFPAFSIFIILIINTNIIRSKTTTTTKPLQPKTHGFWLVGFLFFFCFFPPVAFFSFCLDATAR